MAKKNNKKSSKKTTRKVTPARKVVKKQDSLGSRTTGPIQPLHDKVVVRHLTEAEAGTVNKFGIIIPDTVSKEKPEQGIIVAVGPGKWDEDGERRIPISVQVGDKVVFSKYGYDEVKVGGSEYFIVSEGNILAIIKG